MADPQQPNQNSGALNVAGIGPSSLFLSELGLFKVENQLLNMAVKEQKNLIGIQWVAALNAKECLKDEGVAARNGAISQAAGQLGSAAAGLIVSGIGEKVANNEIVKANSTEDVEMNVEEVPGSANKTAPLGTDTAAKVSGAVGDESHGAEVTGTVEQENDGAKVSRSKTEDDAKEQHIQEERSNEKKAAGKSHNDLAEEKSMAIRNKFNQVYVPGIKELLNSGGTILSGIYQQVQLDAKSEETLANAAQSMSGNLLSGPVAANSAMGSKLGESASSVLAAIIQASTRA